MAHQARLSESSSLLAQVNSPSLTDQQSVCIQRCPPLKHVCLPSKAAVLILLWTAIVGTMYNTSITLSVISLSTVPQPQLVLSYYDPLPYAILAIVMIFYLLSGFIADVCCGRLKTVVASLTFLLISNGFVSLVLLVSLTTMHRVLTTLTDSQGIIVLILCTFSLLFFIVGLAGYQANFIQLGLDQLFEAPSQYLGLFIHYAVWTFNSAGSLVLFIVPTLLCIKAIRTTMVVLILQLTLMVIFILLLLISCWKRRWFHSEPGWSNPYKTVYNIVKFVKSHKYPLRRSAFTHSDNYIPSRLDFAKERFGGPFTTEQVENLKTFLRILIVLFAVGPVFSMEVVASVFIFPLTSLHTIHYINFRSKEWCTGEGMLTLLLRIGSMKNITTSVIVFPAYIWIVFLVFRKKVPKLFTRLGVGILICLLGVISLLIIDVVGHSQNRENIKNQTQCMFQATLTNESTLTYPTLNMRWEVLIPPNLLLGIGPPIVIATTFEFISAQSPQSMKGLLVGVFFAIRGLFQFLNSIIIIPLSLKQPWASAQMIEHPPVTNCGFVYLLLTCVTGLIGLILFSFAAKRYKLRKRDEGIFCQQDVEEVYDRYLAQAALKDVSYEST